MELQAVGRFEWEKIIRRIVVPSNFRAVKLVAMMAATYADTLTGERVRPGEKRLAAVCNLGPSTVRRSLGWLRDHGLLYRVSKGSNIGVANLVDVYQLCTPIDWQRRLTLLPAYEKDDAGLIPHPRRNNPNGEGADASVPQDITSAGFRPQAP